MYTKEDFNKVWKNSSRKDILNQFYYDHMEMEKFKNIINELEKDLEKYSNECGIDERITLKMIGDKLKELKEGK